jgi:hypothetical protein
VPRACVTKPKVYGGRTVVVSAGAQCLQPSDDLALIGRAACECCQAAAPRPVHASRAPARPPRSAVAVSSCPLAMPIARWLPTHAPSMVVRCEQRAMCRHDHAFSSFLFISSFASLSAAHAAHATPPRLASCNANCGEMCARAAVLAARRRSHAPPPSQRRQASVGADHRRRDHHRRAS